VVVQATDNGSPAKTATTTIIIDVPRDLSKPVITNLPLTVTIPENTASGISIFKAIVSDADQQVSFVLYELFMPCVTGT
jgi:hypothetical protein